MNKLTFISVILCLLLAFACDNATEKNSSNLSNAQVQTQSSTQSSNSKKITGINSTEANSFVGSKKTVCGEGVSTSYARGSRGQPTFLNLDYPYPNQIFTVVIWGDNRINFANPPESFYQDEDVCVSGLIESYRGVAQIEATNSKQIQFQP